MKLPSYFADFLGSIEPSPSYKESQKQGHTTLRRRLTNDEDFRAIHVNTFLQGSYKRNTAIHPGKDVDIVVVTSLDPEQITPAAANARLARCLRRYYANVTPQNRSFGVELSTVTMDVVLASSRHLGGSNATSSWRLAEGLEDTRAWVDHPLLIPDRDLGRWVETDPKKQMAWTTDLNAQSGDHFVPFVKMMKWWRKETYTRPKYPKGYVLERLAGECVDLTVRDHAEGFVRLLETIVARFGSYATLGLVPHLPDPGVPSHNVAHRLSADDFATFLTKVHATLPVAREALQATDVSTSAALWRRVFGSSFPEATATKASFPAVPVRPTKPAGFA